ncbi:MULTISPECIES: PLP-dependent aminotransferase family protein [unclassified Leptolyngbya]|uniref:MocR-like pyridoxine biosynthesis transcription factor PdxR n=1 Tax=unclassified Leptolyngbya TaxID=2650499 RepID=UPI0016887468|nr:MULTISPECIES: PLP-dependent aminotransferase family protein [unclassified Leptolyngbya]MBD1910809.1 PLP-dependent aminotransferase family protein [Leptolyngbya sp. FACHB-8]MBD2157622.1 PLP-dependent aminotransferase family protein [Leptolyngbya sp. FACHB-16]
MELTLTLDPQAEHPLHRQLYEELRQAILSGRLSPRQKLPSTRSLAQSLGISRTTVTQSYDQLLSEGYLEARHGSGTFVCAQLPDDLLHSAPAETAPHSVKSSIHLSSYGQRLAEKPFALQAEPQVPISFRYGRPSFQHFPLEVWRKLLLRHSRANIQWLDYASNPQGEYELREAIARYITRARAVQCDPEHILITNGTQQALDLILRVLLEPGEAIALEDPGYLSARRIFLSHNAHLIPIPVDESGLVVSHLASIQVPTIRLVYVTPSHQFPTGATLSLARRLELLSWAHRTGALVLEDDYDSEYRYGDRPIPALQGLDPGHSVIYIGTFSKVLFPSLRIGYLVLPPELAPLMAHAKWLSDRQLSTLDQRVLADFINEGHLESHIRRMRSHYNSRRQTLVHALKQHFGDRVTILGEKAGIHLMVHFSLPLTETDIIQKAAQAGVGLMPARVHCLQVESHCNFILGYSELDEATIERGIHLLAQTLL